MPAPDRARSFLFWVGDFLADPAVAAMSSEEVGAYVLLLCYAWQSDNPGILPNDDSVLANLTRLGERWPKHRTAVLRAFVVTEHTLTQKRMVREAKATERRIAAASGHGRRAAIARWDGELHARAMPGDAISSSSSSNSESYKKGAPRAVSTKHDKALLSDKFTEVREWLLSLDDETEPLSPLAKWFIKSGTKHPAAVIALLEHYRKHRPSNPHAYYAKGSQAREAVNGAAMVAIAEAEQKLRLVR